MKINIANQLKTLSFSFFLIIGLPILILVRGDEFNVSFIIVMVAVLILPIYLYFEYLYFSKGKVIDIDYANNSITIKNNNQVEVIKFENIFLIEKYCSFAVAEDRLQWIPTDEFLYFQLTLDDGTRKIIPCFITFNFNIPYKEIIVRKKFIPSIIFPRWR